MTERLKPKEVPRYRRTLLRRQSNICPLCKQYIAKEQATLDHDHASGHCRAVLHRNCNQIEGRIRAWARRSKIPPDEFMLNLAEFVQRDYSGYKIHPNHRTEIEKQIRKLKSRMRTLKTERAKQRYRDKIQALQEEA